jgi:hypothetical protein
MKMLSVNGEYPYFRCLLKYCLIGAMPIHAGNIPFSRGIRHNRSI